MYSIVGFDIGTTEVKCTLYLVNGLKYFWRIATPKVDINITDSEEITFSPIAILKIVRQLLKKIRFDFPREHILVSIASQAPSLCYWNDEGNAIGVSYLSYYGDPKMNSKQDRQCKMFKRIQYANRLFLQHGIGKISGITGYIVYQLTEQLTLDSVTAWEMGIEDLTDVRIMQEAITPHQFPKIVAPVEKYTIKNEVLEKGVIIAGTTDSALLPISIVPEFADYYIYLGTWGSLLKSQIVEYKDYYKCFHKGNLHSWIISLPNFIQEVDNDSLFLDDMFKQIANEVEANGRIAVCGGLVYKKKDNINELIDHYLPTQKVTLAIDDNSMVGACRLGSIAIKEKHD